MSRCNVKWSLRNLALQHGITDDRTRDWKSLLSLADIAPPFIFSGGENKGKKWNRTYLYKLTLCYMKAKLGLGKKNCEKICLSRKPTFPRNVISSLQESQWGALILQDTSAAPQHWALFEVLGDSSFLALCVADPHHLRVEGTTEAAKNFQERLS